MLGKPQFTNIVLFTSNEQRMNTANDKFKIEWCETIFSFISLCFLQIVEIWNLQSTHNPNLSTEFLDTLTYGSVEQLLAFVDNLNGHM